MANITDSVRIAAGGNSSRIRDLMTELGYCPDYPKHLLPIDDSGQTLIGRIIDQALEVEADQLPTVLANEANAPLFREHPSVDGKANVAIADFDNSMAPFFVPLAENKQRVLGCAGDFYADFSWDEVLDWHESHPFPATFVVGHTVAVDGGATFDIGDNGQIHALRRADRTSSRELINIGVYVFDPHKEVIKSLEKTLYSNIPKKEDIMVAQLIEAGLAGAYELQGTPFNINTAETYRAMQEHVRLSASTIL